VSSRCTVVVFAKAPLAGFAKTRLIPSLGAAGAARLAERMLDHALAQALAADLGPVELCAAPDARHPAFARWQALPLRWSDQGDGDLGTRMGRAMRRALARSPRVLLVGTDAPALDAAVLRRAAQALSGADAVFVPTLDGGYVLVGTTRSPDPLFDGIAWSTPLVMEQTRERLRRHGWRHVELEPLPDIDAPADLVHRPADWPA
jgi:rSAM/selenodomain-associated transferase 1